MFRLAGWLGRGLNPKLAIYVWMGPSPSLRWGDSAESRHSSVGWNLFYGWMGPSLRWGDVPSLGQRSFAVATVLSVVV